MIETRRLKNVVIFIQTILSSVLARKIIYKYIIDIKEKSEIFNSFFAEQCSLIPNKSVLLSQLTLPTEN